jgi:outer membrane protein TolC
LLCVIVAYASAGDFEARAASGEDAKPAAAPQKQSVAERVDLKQCIERAVAAAPDLAVSRWDVSAREAKLKEAQVSRFFPEANVLSLTGAAPRARGTVLNPLDTVSTDALGPFTRVEINIVQPIFTGGKITAGIAAATHAVQEEIAASEGKTAEVIEQVKTLYYNVLLARSVEGILSETRDAFSTALDTARSRRERGDEAISELDVLNLRVGMSEVAKEVPRLTAGGKTALEALRRMMGAERDAPIELKARLLDPAPAHLEPLEHYRTRLFQQNPAWRQIDAGVAAKSDELKTVEADYYPNLFLNGVFAYSYAPRRDRQLNPFAYDDFNFLHGPGGVLGIRWSLNFHITAARAATTRAELGKLEAQRRTAQTGLPLELDEAYRRVEQSRSALDALADGRKAGRAILTLAVANFDLGIGEAREILEGLSNYARVSSDYYEAVKDYNLALAALARVTGEEVVDLEAR